MNDTPFDFWVETIGSYILFVVLVLEALSYFVTGIGEGGFIFYFKMGVKGKRMRRLSFAFC